jgi:hypothetical protein
MRNGSIAEVTGIMVNSGAMMTAKCCGSCLGGSPNMAETPVWDVVAQNCGIVQKRHAVSEKRHTGDAAVAFVMALSQTSGRLSRGWRKVRPFKPEPPQP